MRSSPAFDPYEHPLPPPPGAIPYESPGGLVLPPLEATDQALREFAASPLGVNPLAADDAAALALGQVMYDRHCSVCHGVEGGATARSSARASSRSRRPSWWRRRRG
jgi:mono/diheme cytochrome c family protein